MKNLYFVLALLFFVSCTYDVRTTTKHSESGDTVTVVQQISSLDTASIRKGVLSYNKKHIHKIDYYVNGVLVKHVETTSTTDTAANHNTKVQNSSSSVQQEALFADDAQVRKSAVSQLKNQSDLQHVAFFDANADVRKLAVTMLENETDIQHVAFFDNDEELRKIAEKLLRQS